MKRSILLLIGLLVAGLALADDGPMFRKDVSKTPDMETEHAAIRMLPLYVPAQNSEGTLLTEGIDYYDADGAITETREYVRPLIVHYTDGHVETIDEEGYGGFPGHGQRDAWGAVSLDDGATWNRTNLSRSGDKYSIKIKDGKRKVPYYGDVLRSFTSSDGNKVLVTWVSKFCGSGNPGYAMSLEERGLLATHLKDTGTIADAAACTDLDGDIPDLETPCTYLEDAFGVAGSQGVQSADDLADDGYPLVGDYPYSCAWAARGVMMPPAAEGEASTFTWFKAERLSSGVRDANRPETVCVKGAGCVVTWQEDPDGIRPGHGDGPGEGWSGAVAHHQTDTWYTYIDWDDFGLVAGDTDEYGTFYDETGDLAVWLADNDSGSPKAAVPMSIPVRLTDNAMCTALAEDEVLNESSKAYCHIDFDESGINDFCASTVMVEIETPEGPTTTSELCVTEDGRLMRGNTGSTRARLGLHGYSTLGDYSTDPPAYPIDSAWFYMAYEENKGLGDEGDGEVVPEDLIEKVDMGKNVWYHTFEMFHPELVSQGLMLNQPAVYQDEFTNPEDFLTKEDSLGYNFYVIDPDPVYETQAGIDTTLYQSEIARRPSVISQDWYDAGPSGVVGLQLWKQGIIRRGGPADIMGRRFVIPAGVDCPVVFNLCTTSDDELCTITYSWCDSEPVCDDNPENPDYNKGQCKKNNYEIPELCFPYFEQDGVTLTTESETCTNPCHSATSGCGADDGVCDETTNCETVVSCDVSPDPDANPYCVEGEDICHTVTSCPEPDPEESQTCEPLVPQPDCQGFDADVDNPYDYANMECDTWAYTDGTNPRYVKGFCADPAINLSGNTILLGEDACTDAVTCLEAFPFNEYFDDLDMSADDESILKILQWQQFGPDYDGNITVPYPTTSSDLPWPGDGSNFDDVSWENPYDVAKGHRGFMAGDMVMVMYAWANNWKALTDAHDPFNLYNRRSFDGGLTWTTLPNNWVHTNEIAYPADGTTTCEWMVVEGSVNDEYAECTDYGAGEFEQARNVSQLVGPHTTVLDPRYSPTTRSITETSVSTVSLPVGFYAPLYDDDTRDPSRYFMVYETGESSAYDAGEATPLDLFYSRAIDWGDDYLVWQDEALAEDCLPSADELYADGENDDDPYGFCNEFDALEGSNINESGEASVTASPGGMFFYSTWNQIDFDQDGYEVSSDAIFRRVLFLDDYIPTDDDS